MRVNDRNNSSRGDRERVQGVCTPPFSGFFVFETENECRKTETCIANLKLRVST